MQIEKIIPFFGAVVLAAGLTGCNSMGDPHSSSENSEDEDQFEVSLVRVADLEATGKGAFSNIGTDPLTAGRVEIEELSENEVEARVQGAASNVTYSVNFCSFAAGLGGCSGVATLSTDAMGQGEVKFAFSQTGTFAGVFLLSRPVDGQAQNQFVTGFSLPPNGGSTNQSEMEAEADQEFEVSLQPAGLISGGLGSGFGANGNDPLVAGRVQVEEQVEVQLTGAAAGAVYDVEFCRFGVGTSGCLAVGSVTTDAAGNAQAELGFPVMGIFDGIFRLTRTVNGATLNEFVTGFRIL